MHKKQTIKSIALGLFLMLGLVGFAFTNVAGAVGANGCETETVIIKCDNVEVSNDGVENTGAWSLLLTVINILTAGVGVVALGGIVYGAILYISAGGSPEQVKKAMEVFTNVVIGVIAFAAMFALLNFLIPGGLFTTPASTP